MQKILASPCMNLRVCMKSSPVVISITGERGGLILVTSCHAQELIFENVPKLVKIFIGVSLVIFEKLK